jgi:dTMP kinase
VREQTTATAARRGVLVVLEGIDGAGKTTQAALLADRLAAAGVTVVRAKEPTDGPHGARLRASARTGRLPPEEELALFEADRREHVATVIAPALARGDVVLLDRYYFSTAAYQGARGLDAEEIVARNERFAPVPDLLVILEVPVDVGLARIRERGDGEGNLFERREALERCAAIFAALDRPYCIRLDGTRRADAVHGEVAARLAERLAARPPGARDTTDRVRAALRRPSGPPSASS